MEWTAMSARPSASAFSSSLTNSPLPPTFASETDSRRIALREHAEQLDFQTGVVANKTLADKARLPDGKCAFTRGDDDFAGQGQRLNRRCTACQMCRPDSSMVCGSNRARTSPGDQSPSDQRRQRLSVDLHYGHEHTFGPFDNAAHVAAGRRRSYSLNSASSARKALVVEAAQRMRHQRPGRFVVTAPVDRSRFPDQIAGTNIAHELKSPEFFFTRPRMAPSDEHVVA
jgi:hypothetical protein